MGLHQLEADVAKSIYTKQYEVFKELLRKTREGKGLTQAQMGRRLKMRQSAVSNIELGERRLDVVELLLWCEALEMSIDAFVGMLSGLLRKRNLLAP